MSVRFLAPLFAAALALSACDSAAPRTAHRAPAPKPVADSILSDPAIYQPTHEAEGPVRWDAAKGAFVAGGEVLRAEKLWTFEGATDGFVAIGGEAQPAQHSGMLVQELGPALSLRTPSGLNVEGRNRALVLVRLTRLRAAKPWDGTVYYSTRAHGESQQYFAKPTIGGDPAVGETQVLVYDMRQLRAGGDDWKTSIIDQVRIDLDAAPGGVFLIRQVAIAQSQESAIAAAQPKPPPRKPTLTLPERPPAEKVADIQN